MTAMARWLPVGIGRRGRLLLLLAAVLAVGGCMPQPETTQGQATFNLYQVFFWAGGVVAAIVWILTTVAIIRYRRRGDQLPTQVRSNNRLEFAWTAIPFLTVAALSVFTLLTLSTVDAIPRNPKLTVDVLAYRWSWRFTYEGQGVVVNGGTGHPPELVLPAGQTTEIVLTSADVIHSFWVPDFLFKRDAIPGVTNRFAFTVEQPGTWSGQCARYCGLYHDQMTFVVRAMPAPEFQAWLAAQRASGSSSANGAAPSAAGGSSSGGAPSPAATGGSPSAGTPPPAAGSSPVAPSSAPSAGSVP